MKDKMVIIDKYVIFNNKKSNTFSYETIDDLVFIINNYFIEHKYGKINLYKNVMNRITKVGIFYDLDSNLELDIICNKNLIKIVRDEMESLGNTMNKPNGGLNKQKVLK